MTYTPTTIKQHKGKLVMLAYLTKNNTRNELSGVITATTRNHILFLINNDKKAGELPLLYDKILEITKPEKIKNEVKDV